MISSISQHSYELYLNIDRTFDIPEKEDRPPLFIYLRPYLCKSTLCRSQLMLYTAQVDLQSEAFGAEVLMSTFYVFGGVLLHMGFSAVCLKER